MNIVLVPEKGICPFCSTKTKKVYHHYSYIDAYPCPIIIMICNGKDKEIVININSMEYFEQTKKKKE